VGSSNVKVESALALALALRQGAELGSGLRFLLGVVCGWNKSVMVGLLMQEEERGGRGVTCVRGYRNRECRSTIGCH